MKKLVPIGVLSIPLLLAGCNVNIPFINHDKEKKQDTTQQKEQTVKETKTTNSAEKTTATKNTDSEIDGIRANFNKEIAPYYAYVGVALEHLDVDTTSTTLFTSKHMALEKYEAALNSKNLGRIDTSKLSDVEKQQLDNVKSMVKSVQSLMDLKSKTYKYSKESGLDSEITEKNSKNAITYQKQYEQLQKTYIKDIRPIYKETLLFDEGSILKSDDIDEYLKLRDSINTYVESQLMKELKNLPDKLNTIHSSDSYKQKDIIKEVNNIRKMIAGLGVNADTEVGSTYLSLFDYYNSDDFLDDATGENYNNVKDYSDFMDEYNKAFDEYTYFYRDSPDNPSIAIFAKFVQ